MQDINKLKRILDLEIKNIIRKLTKKEQEELNNLWEEYAKNIRQDNN